MFAAFPGALAGAAIAAAADDVESGHLRRRFAMRHAMLIISSVLVVAAVSLWSSPRDAQGGPAMKSTYLVLYHPGPHWVAGKPIRQQPPKEHGKYLLDLYARGAMKSAGPFEDNTGAAVVI